MIKECNTCYGPKLQGFIYGCKHMQCVDCAKQFLMTAARDISLLPPKCCGAEIDLEAVARFVLPSDQAEKLIRRCEEIKCTNKLYCPGCNSFINLESVKSVCVGSTKRVVLCTNNGCKKCICLQCKAFHHNGPCEKSGSASSQNDRLAEELAIKNGWKRCPKCAIFIEHATGCDHMTCRNCLHEFCFECLATWAGMCPTGCSLWRADRLETAGNRRVQEMEEVRGAPIVNAVQRAQVLQRAIRGLQAHDRCRHDWEQVDRRHLRTHTCENCSFYLNVYGYQCGSDCGQTVCHTCRFHRLPRQGWN
jgi:hypothetical protein